MIIDDPDKMCLAYYNDKSRKNGNKTARCMSSWKVLYFTMREDVMQRVCLGIAVIACLWGVASCASTGEKAAGRGESVSKEQPKIEAQQDPNMAAKKIVVARINGAEITMFDLVKTMNRIGARRATATTPADAEEVKKEALDRLILQELAWQKAQAEGLRTKKENIDTAIANLKENIGGDEKYRQLLEQEQVTESDLRSQVEKSLTLEAIFAKEVYEKVVVPEEELKKAYEREKGKYIQPEKVSVIDVHLFTKTDESLAEKAESLRSQILADKNRDPWQLVLDGTFTVRNYEPRKEKDGDLFEEAKKLKKDEISRVIKTPDGAHIVKLREYSPERQLTLEEVRPNLERQLRAPAQEMRLREWEREIRANATIEILDGGSGKTQESGNTAR
jgi:parvulin-like peptidyl-prolyl isomerase